MERESRILIAGAGLAGLTAAIRLAHAGIRPVVVEKAPEIRADGFIITLSRHCYRSAGEIGVLGDIRARDNRVRASSYHDRAGRAILALDYDRLFEAGDVVQIMRDDLEHVLYQHARDAAEFRFSNGVARVEQADGEVAITFDDGTEETYDLVVGADGVHSGVRAAAFAPADVTKHDLGLHAAAFRAENTLGLERKYEAYLEPRRHTIVYTTRSNDLACIFIWAREAPVVPAHGRERLDYLARVYAHADPRVRGLIDARAPDDPMYMDSLVQIEMPRWHTGRVVLVGDAAHALTQLSGHGASISIAGASTLARALAEGPPEDAFARYEAEIRPLVETLQPATRRNAKWYVPGGLAVHFLRDCALRLLPDEVWIRYFKHKYSEA